ncbi:MAG: hypothetical protein IJW59_00020 [Clostridia bacterium]|nr:hypothetical protein [Clostridia bacterium]
MTRKPKLLYWILSATSILSIITLIALLVCLYVYQEDSTWMGIFSAWISIISGLLFSAVISLIVQVINDNISVRELEYKKTQIRLREINIITQELSNFISFFHDTELFLMNKYKIKDSLEGGNLNINIIQENMKHLHNVKKKANKENLSCIENYLLISENTKNQYNKVVELLNNKRQEYENINIDLNTEVFSEKELNSLNVIPIIVNEYNNNRYILIDSFIKIIESFDLKINFDNNKWWNILALLLTYNPD